MGFRNYVFNSMNHYSFVFKAAHPLAIQLFLSTALLFSYTIRDEKVPNLNNWFKGYLRKLCDLD